jgi:hypothetical protein
MTKNTDPLSRLKELLEQIKPMRARHDEATKAYYAVKRRLDDALPIPADRGDFSYRLQTSLDKFLIRQHEVEGVRRIHEEFLAATATLNAAKAGLDPVEMELRTEFDACKARLSQLCADVKTGAMSRLVKILIPFSMDAVDADRTARGLFGIQSLDNVISQVMCSPTLEGRCAALIRELKKLSEIPT